MMSNSTQHKRTALVIGGSLAGMFTARVLADHFDYVTILERDQLPDGVASRPGVPQDRQVHILLERGAQIADSLFPGIHDDLVAKGAHKVDLSQDMLVWSISNSRWMDRYISGRTSYSCSRLLFEQVIRQRLYADVRISFVERSRVCGLQTDDSGHRVTGVLVEDRDTNAQRTMLADFVVDASGRSSKASTWLPKIGYDAPEETSINAGLGYAGRRYRLAERNPDRTERDWKSMLIPSKAPHYPRAGLIYAEENGVWMVLVTSYLHDYPPTDEAGFLAFAESIHPAFYAQVKDATPVGNIIGYRQTQNRLCHFDRLQRWPEHFVVVGDAVCCFNPIYGQGMSVAAITADTLGQHLTRANGNLDGLAQKFQRAVPKITETAWMLATGADANWLPDVDTPKRSLARRAVHWYINQLLMGISTNRNLREAFSSVQNLMKPPTSLFHPLVAKDVFRHWVTNRQYPQNA
ncbi:MAG: FAD-dependent monooxygenase [Chloroflexota bacterium]